MYQIKFLLLLGAFMVLSACDTAPRHEPTPIKQDTYISTNESSCREKLKTMGKPSYANCTQGAGCDDYVSKLRIYDKEIEKITNECNTKHTDTLAAPIPAR